METAKLVLEFIKVLAWPFTTVLLALVFRKPIADFFGRLKKVEFPGGFSDAAYPVAYRPDPGGQAAVVVPADRED
jgi:hypothetical protein